MVSERHGAPTYGSDSVPSIPDSVRITLHWSLRLLIAQSRLLVTRRYGNIHAVGAPYHKRYVLDQAILNKVCTHGYAAPQNVHNFQL